MNAVRLGTLCLSLAALLTTGCSLLDGGGGSTTRSPSPTPTQASATAVSGTVQSVDSQAKTLTVGAGAANSNSLRSSDRTVLTYDSSTVVEYQGRKTYNPQDVEVGDQIAAQVERSGGRALARSIKVISSVSSGGTTSGAGLAPWSAKVRSVNPGNRSIELVQSGREQYPVMVLYDENTRVEFEGRSYKPVDLERDDEVQVRTRSVGSQIVADQIVVTRNLSGSAGAAAGLSAQLHGTIRNVDTAARVIELDAAGSDSVQGHMQGFDTTQNGNATSIAYDASTIVEYKGQRYGIANLERGDVVNIDVRPLANGYLAKRITVAQAR